MAIKRLVQLGTPQAFSASGQFSIELSPVQGTITELIVFVRSDVTTTTATNFNDYWDRLISSMSLGGGGGNFFTFSNMRAAYHFTRLIKTIAAKRPTVVADSQTNALTQFAYLFHFGTQLRLPDGRRNKFDLSAGIPPVPRGNLTLSGVFGAAGAMGTNVTTNTGTTLDVYAHVVQPESAGEGPARWMPRMLPNWSMRTPTPTATSAPFGTQDDVPGGDFLRSLLVMLTNGTNAPRDSGVLSSLEVYDQRASRSIVRIGGQSDTAPPAVVDEVVGQLDSNGWPPTDNATTLGVPALTHGHDRGLHAVVLADYSDKADPHYGLDLRGVSTGGVQIRYGVVDATGITMDVVYERYKINPDYPAA
jgi:hypothetical protein